MSKSRSKVHRPNGPYLPVGDIGGEYCVRCREEWPCSTVQQTIGRPTVRNGDMTKALLIPYDENKAVEEMDIDFDGGWIGIAAALVTTRGEAGLVDVKSFASKGTQLIYDDMGLYNQPNNTNPRAMKLWAHLAGVPLDAFRQNLVGNFIVIGLDSNTGDSLDVTSDVRYFFGEEGVNQ